MAIRWCQPPSISEWEPRQDTNRDHLSHPYVLGKTGRVRRVVSSLAVLMAIGVLLGLTSRILLARSAIEVTGAGSQAVRSALPLILLQVVLMSSVAAALILGAVVSSPPPDGTDGRETGWRVLEAATVGAVGVPGFVLVAVVLAAPGIVEAYPTVDLQLSLGRPNILGSLALGGGLAGAVRSLARRLAADA